jgi:hypothetical protein
MATLAMRLSTWLETVAMDAAYAWRSLKRTPGSSAAAALSLASAPPPRSCAGCRTCSGDRCRASRPRTAW